MDTVIDPLGTPAIVFNKSGRTILNLNSGVSGSPVPIPYVSEEQIVLVTNGSSPDRFEVELPASVEIGSSIYVTKISGPYSVNVYPASGETINGITQTSGPVWPRYIKVTATDWVSF